MPGATAAPSTPTLEEVKRKCGVRSYTDLVRRRQELDSSGHIVYGLLPARSIGLLVGDSGLGKSPLLYQLALCVAAGIEFLGAPTTRSDVLLLDYENGIGDSEDLLARLAKHLGLPAVSENLWIWNGSDVGLCLTGEEIIRIWASVSLSPSKLVVIDPLSGFQPGAEEKNSDAARVLSRLRSINREFGTTSVLSHHIRKPSRDSKATVNLADFVNPREWFSEARGARALINSSDVRLGLDLPGVFATVGKTKGKVSEELSLVMRGFGRVRGEVGPYYLARVFDEEGDPVGYRKLVSAELLFNGEQQRALAALADRFRTGEAVAAYGRGDQATSDFLNKCVRLGLIRKVGRGLWEKVPVGG
jgi:hypothetical protein